MKKIELSDVELNDLIMCTIVVREGPWGQTLTDLVQRLVALDEKLTKTLNGDG